MPSNLLAYLILTLLIGLYYISSVLLIVFKSYCRFGFAGEPSPRCIIPSEIKCPETGKIRQIYSYKNEADLYALLVDFIHTLYFK